MKIHCKKFWLIAPFLAASCALPTRANDGALTFGGSPQLLKGHPTVAMESEVIRITVGEETVRADCSFVFKNSGPACTVRLGFPDEGYDGNPTSPGGFFKGFRSYVDGKYVPTSLTTSGKPDDEDFRYWHVKDVKFAANGRHAIRDVYSVDIGGQIAVRGFYNIAAYTLHTGASWRGNIGRSEIVVTFNRKVPHRPFVVKDATALGKAMYELNWDTMPPATLYYQGPSRPTVQNNTLRFVRANWRPTNKDDIRLFFGHAEEQAAQWPYVHIYPFNRALTDSDLAGKTPWQLQLMRNAIYARHGRPFQDANLSRYFKAQKWYKPDKNWQDGKSDERLSVLERRNAQFVVDYEKHHE